MTIQKDIGITNVLFVVFFAQMFGKFDIFFYIYCVRNVCNDKKLTSNI